MALVSYRMCQVYENMRAEMWKDAWVDIYNFWGVFSSFFVFVEG